MAVIQSESNETRIHFDLLSQDGTGTKTRTISIPGIPVGEPYNTVVQNFYTFHDYIMSEMSTFVQPSAWRDNTGSSYDDDEGELDERPYTTQNVRMEFIHTEKTVFDGNDPDD